MDSLTTLYIEIAFAYSLVPLSVGALLLQYDRSNYGPLRDRLLFIYKNTRHLVPEEYTFLDYRAMFPGSYPLTLKVYRRTLMPFSSNNNGEKDEYHLDIWRLKVLQKWHILQFYLSMPIVQFEVENVLNLPFEAKPGMNIFGGNLTLALDQGIVNEVSDKEIKDILQFALQDHKYFSVEIWRLGIAGYTKFTTPSATHISFTVLTGILKPISDYFGLSDNIEMPLAIAGTPLLPSRDKSPATLYVKWSILDEQGNIVCVVEVKEPCFFDEKSRATITKDDLCYGKMAEIVKELQTFMIAAAVRFGILFDGYFLILIELVDDESFYAKRYLHFLPGGGAEIRLPPGEGLHIPFKTRILNVHSAAPSFLEGLTYFIYSAKQAKSKPMSPIFNYLHLALKITDTPTPQGTSDASSRAEATPVQLTTSDPVDREQIRYMYFNWRTEVIFLGRSEYSISYKIQAKHLKDVILEDIEDEDYVVMKIFEPIALHETRLETTPEWDREDCEEYYERMWKIVLELGKNKEFNNMYLKHEEVQIEYFEGFGEPMKGKAIISKYIESEPIPQTLEMFDLAKRQLELVHESGVHYNDNLKDADVVFATGKFYFNFGEWETRPADDGRDRDRILQASLYELKLIFDEVLQQK